MFRLRSLIDLGEALRRDRARLPLTELPACGDPAAPLGRDVLASAVGGELTRIRETLPSRRELIAVAPADYRRGLAFLRLTALALAARTDDLGWRVVTTPPGLGAMKRLALVLRARIGLG